MFNMLIACTAFVFVFVCPLDLLCILHSEFVIIFIAYMVYHIQSTPTHTIYSRCLLAFQIKFKHCLSCRACRFLFFLNVCPHTDLHMFQIRKIPKTQVNNRILQSERERERDDKQSCLFASRLRAHTIQCQTCSAYIHIYYMRYYYYCTRRRHDFCIFGFSILFPRIRK